MIKRLRSSLLAKVFLLTTVILLFISFFVYGILAWFMPQTYSDTLNEVLDRQVINFITEVEEVTMERSGGLFDQLLERTGVSFLELYKENGEPVDIPSGQSGGSDREYNSAVEAASDDETAPVLWNSYYFSFAGSDASYLLKVYGEASRVMQLKQAFTDILPLLTCVVLAAALLVSWCYAHMITRPVLKISRISKEMSRLKFDWKVSEKHSDELGILEKSLNDMSEKLKTTLTDLETANKQLVKEVEYEKKLDQERLDFFSAASHELKTPITIIKGQLQGMLLGIGVYRERDKYLARSLEVANNLEQMVQEILTISRLESTAGAFTRQQVDYIPLMKEYIRKTEDLLVQKDIQVQLNVPDSVMINGNTLLVEKVFSILIGNAVKYSPDKAVVSITVKRQNDTWNFSIENTGTYIKESEFSKLFDAFYRIEQSRNRKTGGSGLGLYIVQKILQQYGSVCKVCNTKTGVKFYFSL